MNEDWKDKILQGEATLALLEQYIEYNDDVGLLGLLQKIDLTELLDERIEEFPHTELYVSDLLLNHLLTMCKEYNREKLVPTIIDYWDSQDSFSQSTFIRLFMYNYFNIMLLQFVARSMKDEWSYINIIRQLITMDSSPEVEFASRRANDVYNKQSYNTFSILAEWVDLRAEDDGWGNDRLRWFVEDMISHNRAPLKTPKYVIGTDKNIYGGDFFKMIDSLPDTYHVIPSDVSQEDIIRDITAGIRAKDEEMADTVADEYQYRFLTNKLEFNSLIINRIRKASSLDTLANLDIFRVLGPVNKAPDANLEDNHPCERYGGCRMLTCDQYEIRPYDSIEENETYDIVRDVNYLYDPESAPNEKLRKNAIYQKYTGDWFTGSCYYCLRKVRRIENAAREPLSDGGWRRCYCSWKCVLNKLLSDPEGDDRDIKYFLAVNYAKQCRNIGIYARTNI